MHLLKLPLEKPTHGVNNLHGGEEGGGVVSELFTLITANLITKKKNNNFALSIDDQVLCSAT